MDEKTSLIICYIISLCESDNKILEYKLCCKQFSLTNRFLQFYFFNGVTLLTK